MMAGNKTDVIAAVISKFRGLTSPLKQDETGMGKYNLQVKLMLPTLMAATLLHALPISAEINNENTENIIQTIEKDSDGKITIDMPANILELIMQRPAHHQGQVIRPGVNKLNGYRIQVFSDGRNQSTLEARAKARGNAILARMPKYRGQVYTHSSAPNWYTRVGNFKNQGEAETALEELKRSFPSFASEMRIVKCQIVVIK